MSLISKTVYCTTREAAEILGVSTRTAQLWAENGLLEAWKTGGGHRRINRTSVQRLLDSEARPSAIAAPRGERLKILVVEDDCVLLKLYKTVIGHWNLPLDITTASNGVDGLIRVGRDAPDVMIADLGMPGLDGFHLIRSLASTSYREGMEIIVISGLDVAEIETHGALPPGVRIFSKPVPFAELHAIFTEILYRRAVYLSKEAPWNP